MLALLVSRGALGGESGESLALEPGVGRPVLLVAQRVEQVAVELADPQFVETLHQRQGGSFVGRQVDVGGAQDERLVALVAAAVEQRRRLGVGAGDEDAGNLHDVELETRRVQALDLLVLRHQNLATLVAALLGARALVLDVVAGHAGLNEATDEVAHVRVTAVAGIGVGDDERAIVVSRRRIALLRGHSRAQILLVAVGGEQGAHQHCGLVRHLAERIARQIGSRVLARRALGRGRPAAEVDAFDPQALDHHRLTGRVRTERRDALSRGEQLAQAVIERRRRVASQDVIVGDGAALLDDLARRVQTRRAREPRAVKPLLGVGDFLLERSHIGAPARP